MTTNQTSLAYSQQPDGNAFLALTITPNGEDQSPTFINLSSSSTSPKDVQLFSSIKEAMDTYLADRGN